MNKKIIDAIESYILIINFFLILFGNSLFWIGYHAVDMGANHFILSEILENKGIILKDKSLQGNTANMRDIFEWIEANDYFNKAYSTYKINLNQI